MFSGSSSELNLYFYPKNLLVNGKEGKEDQGETY